MLEVGVSVLGFSAMPWPEAPCGSISSQSDAWEAHSLQALCMIRSRDLGRVQAPHFKDIHGESSFIPPTDPHRILVKVSLESRARRTSLRVSSYSLMSIVLYTSSIARVFLHCSVSVNWAIAASGSNLRARRNRLWARVSSLASHGMIRIPK